MLCFLQFGEKPCKNLGPPYATLQPRTRTPAAAYVRPRTCIYVLAARNAHAIRMLGIHQYAMQTTHANTPGCYTATLLGHANGPCKRILIRLMQNILLL
jgi:hypothetical protein